MEPEHIVEQTIAMIRVSTIDELRMMALEQSQETMTSSEVIEIVEWVLQEVSDALKNAVTGYLDQQGDWWNGYGTTGREFFRGSLTEDYPLPRHQKDGLQ
jgi:hypothetical protein